MAESAKFAKIAYNALADKKGENIKIIDISEISPIADYFIIADGANQNQLQAMCDSVEEELYKAGCKLKQTEGIYKEMADTLLQQIIDANPQANQ